MPENLYAQVLATIGRHDMIRPGSRIGLGVSGGADSTAMLRIFAELRVQLGARFVVLHFNHQLRGEEADEDERFVKALAQNFDFEFQTGRADVAAESGRQGWNLEDAARRLRYRFFAAEAKAHSLERIAVAHTADDQAETVLAHLLRGTGLTGLAGIYPATNLLIRPLLDVRREDLREFLRGLKQPWREDATNDDVTRIRARVRHELIPLLVRDFDAAAVTRLARLADHARENEDFWRSLEAERFVALVTRESSGALTLAVSDLLSPLVRPMGAASERTPDGDSHSSPGLALSRRLVRSIFAELRGSRERLTARHVDSVLRLARKSQSGARVELPGVRVERVFDRLCFRAGAPPAIAEDKAGSVHAGPKTGGFAYTLLRPHRKESVSIVVTEIHRRISLKMVDWPPARSDTVTARCALDFERVRWPLILRNWRPGDSYCPQGSRRVRKLKRLLLQSRVPRDARGSWPVLTSAGSVIWASGYPVAEECAAGQNTRVGLVIREENL